MFYVHDLPISLWRCAITLIDEGSTQVIVQSYIITLKWMQVIFRACMTFSGKHIKYIVPNDYTFRR